MTRTQQVAIVVLEAAATPTAVASVLRASGLDPQPGARWRQHGSRLLTILPAEPDADLPGRLADLPEVRRALLLDGTRLYERWPDGGDSLVALSPQAVFGGGRPVVIAGPCSVESEDQIVETAEMVANAGAVALRGGVFKPRTSPYDFGGLGEFGLELLTRAGERSGLPVVTEALESRNLDAVAAHADMIQIGSRNMHNSSLLFRAGAHPSGRPILLKRGFAATIDELLEAAEYVLLGRVAAGHRQPGLVLCERGIRSFGADTRFTLDVAAVPLLAQRTHLPRIVDPSHAVGVRGLVAPCARAALAAGAHGLLVEVHRDPDAALCDARQSLGPAEFGELMASL